MGLCQSTPQIMRQGAESDVLELTFRQEICGSDHIILQGLGVGIWQINGNKADANVHEGHTKIPLIFNCNLKGIIESVTLRKISLLDILYQKYDFYSTEESKK